MFRGGDGELITCAGAQPCKSAVAAARAVAGLCTESLSSMSASILLCLVMEPFETDDLKVCWCCHCVALSRALTSVCQDWKSILDDIKEALFTALAQRNVCQRAGIILNKIVTGLDVRTPSHDYIFKSIFLLCYSRVSRVRPWALMR